MPSERITSEEIEKLNEEEKLSSTTYFWLSKKCNADSRIRKLLCRTVEQFDSGPQTLRELARNAVRHVLGGVRFRSRALRLPLPATLVGDVTLPTARLESLKEQLLSLSAQQTLEEDIRWFKFHYKL